MITRYRFLLFFPPLLTAGAAVAQLDLGQEPVAFGFFRPLYVTHAGDGSGRLFVVEQLGRVRIIDATGNLLATDFLDLGATGLNRVTQTMGEQGLLGLAFHPEYSANGRFFVSYTRLSDGASVIEEFSVSADPNIADASSGQIRYGPVAQPQPNHNGGHIVFDPFENFLYFGLGDGGGGDDDDVGHTPGLGNGQDTTVPLGKILRFDVDNGFQAPPSNPFFGMAGFLDEIYAYGLRNPWRFTFDRGGTRQLFCGDVGQRIVEEVDIIEAGDNLGWRRMEGTLCHDPLSECQTGNLVLPIHEYQHTDGRCSVTGGHVYRGSKFPNMYGKYFFADYCTGEIWSLEETAAGVWEEKMELDSALFISTFGEGEDGELYACQHTGLSRVVHLVDNNLEPAPEIHVSPLLLDFGNAKAGVQTNAMSFTIQNVGFEPLTFSSIALTGGETDQFSFDPAPDTSDLPSNESRNLSLRFLPTSDGVKSATVALVSNDPDEAIRILAVRGTGVDSTGVSNVLFY